MTDFRWPDAAVKRLEELYTEGLSYGDIASHLNNYGMSRSAIAGKVRRLKLPPRRDEMPAPRPKRKSVRKPRPLPTADTIRDRHRRRQTALAPQTGCAVQLMGLTSTTCRWPIAGHGEHIWFCGTMPETRRPYCHYHCNISFTDGYRLAEKTLGPDADAAHQGARS